jgi:cobalt-zinc-cadmium efflux system membrane fusion protein
MEEIQAPEADTRTQENTNQIRAAARPVRLRRMLTVVAALALVAVGGVIYARRSSSRATGAPASGKAENKIQPTANSANTSADVVTASEKEVAQLTIEPVAEHTLDVECETTGKVAFNEDRLTPVYTPYAGRVVEVLVNKGAVVRVGQPLLVVESPEFVAAQNDLLAARSDADKARIALDAAEKAAARARRLHEHEALATKDLQQAEADLRRAAEELRRAEAAVTVAENRLALFGKDKQEIAQLGSRPGAIDRRVIIRAPIGGTVVERKVGPGQYVKPDLPDPMFLISDLSTLWVQADVYEALLPQVHIGAPVQISVAAYPDRTFPARISFISPTVDPTTRTVHVRSVVPNVGGLLKPAMFAKVKLGAAAPRPVAVVPASAVIAQNNTSLVFVEESRGRFHRREVKTGRDLQGFTVVEAGLKPGERVVTHGVLLLNGSGGKPAESRAGKGE